MNKNILLLSLLISVAMLSCKQISNTKELEKIISLEEIVSEKRAKPGIDQSDLSVFRELAESYVAFTDKYPDAPESPDFLFRAGELYSQELNELQRAIELFSRNYEQYPNHETAPHALFLKGYLYHNVLKDLINAELTYREFLDKFAEHDLAASAQFEIEQLGVPEDQVLENLRNGLDSTIQE